MGVPSLFSAMMSEPYDNYTSTHLRNKTERDASERAKTYFEKNYGVNWDGLVRYKRKEALIERFFPTQ
jgi:hypothetical protein